MELNITVKYAPVISKLDDSSVNGKLQDSENVNNFPSWVKNAAKMLNGGSEGQDWLALAFKLGMYCITFNHLI